MKHGTDPLVAGRFPTAGEASAIAERSREARGATTEQPSARTRIFRRATPAASTGSRLLAVAEVLPEFAAIREARAQAFDETTRAKGATAAREWAIETISLLDVEIKLLRESRGKKT